MKKTTIVVIIVILAAILGGYIYLQKDKKTTYNLTAVKRGDVVQEVSVTGNVKPAEDIDLAFEKSGKISRIYAKVSDKITANQILVILDNADVMADLSQAEAKLKNSQAQLEQYQAALEARKAELDELKQGTRSEEIKVQETKVANTKIALEDAKKTLVDKLQDAYTKAEDAVRTKTDPIFNNPRSSSPQILSSITADPQLKIDTEIARFQVENSFTSWRTSLDQLTTAGDLPTYISQAKEKLNQIKSFLDKAALVVTGASANVNLSQTTLDTYRSDISTGRTNVNTAITNLTTAEKDWRTAEANLTLAEDELILKKAGATPEQIAAQEAKIREAQADIASQEATIQQYEANVQSYRVQLAKTELRSPINAIVTKQNAKIGKIISANDPLVYLISEAQFQIEANVPEADIAKIKINDSTEVTLDAYDSSVIFEAKVTAIDPAETIVGGMPTYKTTFQFTQKDERIKSGMTANLTVLTAKRENTLFISQRTLVQKKGESFVSIYKEGRVEEIKITAGLTGSDGNIEVLSGLKEGDEIIIPQE